MKTITTYDINYTATSEQGRRYEGEYNGCWGNIENLETLKAFLSVNYRYEARDFTSKKIKIDLLRITKKRQCVYATAHQKQS